MKFKVGQRVAVYNRWGRIAGTVTSVSKEGDHLVSVVNKSGVPGDFHPKQLRRLRKKTPLRRVWIDECDITTGDEGDEVFVAGHEVADWVEFVEVRRKK